MPLRRSIVHTLDVLDRTETVGAAGPAGQLGDVRAVDRSRARRPLHDASPHRGRPVRRRRSPTRRRAHSCSRWPTSSYGCHATRSTASRLPSARGCSLGERRPPGRRARAAAAFGGDRHLRRRSPRPPRRARCSARRRRDRRSSPSIRTRVACWAARCRCSPRSSVASSSSTRPASRTCSSSSSRPDTAALAGRGVRAQPPARDRRRARRGRRRIPVRARARRRPRPAPFARPRRVERCRSSRRLVDAHPRACGRRRGGAAAALLGRPLEVEGTVVGGDHRGPGLGFPTANLEVEGGLLVPTYGIYAGAVGERRAAVSIGVNPHYGGTERRIEAFLLDWSGDLYGRGSSSSCGSGCATSARSTSEAELSSSRSPATSSRRGRPCAPSESRASFPPDRRLDHHGPGTTVQVERVICLECGWTYTKRVRDSGRSPVVRRAEDANRAGERASGRARDAAAPPRVGARAEPAARTHAAEVVVAAGPAPDQPSPRSQPLEALPRRRRARR